MPSSKSSSSPADAPAGTTPAAPLRGPLADRLTRLGVVTRPHGLRGEVRMRLHAAQGRAFDASSIPAGLFLEPPGGSPRPVRIVRARAVPAGIVLLELEGVATREQAESLRDAEVLAERGDLPEPGPEEWYAADLVGLRAVSPAGDVLGTVRETYFNGAQEVLVIETGSGDVDVPLVDAHVGDVDPASGSIVIPDLEALRT